MNRNEMVEKLETQPQYWDTIVIGGGATGLGAAVEAASRGYKTLLLEQHDFAKGTSSRSTKLIHGGVRYLQQGNISLVLEALHERGLLIQNAPHLVHHQSFIVPSYEWWNGPFYGVGLKVYDLLAGKLGLGPSKILSREETLARIPTLEPEGLRGGVIYYDGQFDDARLAVNLAQTAGELGGTPINYMEVTGLAKSESGMLTGVRARDAETGKDFEINGRVVINATGVFTDDILRMDEPGAKKIITSSQGVHLVLDKEFLPGNSAILVPHTSDGRVLFAVPWHRRVVVGTTDTPMEEPALEPRALDEEIDFILDNIAKYLSKDPTRADVLSVFAGLRPLVNPKGVVSNTAGISRDHYLAVSSSGLVTITGGKWTTYRKMAEEAIDQAALVAGLDTRECVSKKLRIHGWLKNTDKRDPLHYYGSDILGVKKLIKINAALGEKLHPELPYLKAQVIWAVRQEMARNVEDVLARRTRAILLDAKASIEAAPETARLMAREFGFGRKWQRSQVEAFRELADGYLLNQ
jgi:glycerol-3-phosphate dehydrogenase